MIPSKQNWTLLLNEDQLFQRKCVKERGKKLDITVKNKRADPAYHLSSYICWALDEPHIKWYVTNIYLKIRVSFELFLSVLYMFLYFKILFTYDFGNKYMKRKWKLRERDWKRKTDLWQQERLTLFQNSLTLLNISWFIHHLTDTLNQWHVYWFIACTLPSVLCF